jgi:hypothetical protein
MNRWLIRRQYYTEVAGEISIALHMYTAVTVLLELYLQPLTFF